jgi:hypothetical protein
LLTSIGGSISATMAFMSSMAAVKEVQKRAQQEQGEGEVLHHVRAVFCPEKVSRDR